MLNDQNGAYSADVETGAAAESATLTVCDKGGKSRVWIEGELLTRGEWPRGTLYTLRVEGERVILQRDPEGKRKVSGRTRAGRSLPIIDCMAREVQFLPIGAALTVTVRRDVIVCEVEK